MPPCARPKAKVALSLRANGWLPWRRKPDWPSCPPSAAQDRSGHGDGCNNPQAHDFAPGAGPRFLKVSSRPVRSSIAAIQSRDPGSLGVVATVTVIPNRFAGDVYEGLTGNEVSDANADRWYPGIEGGNLPTTCTADKSVTGGC